MSSFAFSKFVDLRIARTGMHSQRLFVRHCLTNSHLLWRVESPPSTVQDFAAAARPGRARRAISTHYQPRSTRRNNRDVYEPSLNRKMSSIHLAKETDLDHARYVITLSEGKRLVLFRLPIISGSECTQPNQSLSGWSYYAMEAECPHAGGPMSDARIDIEDSSYVASCPWHAYDFNVETGESSYGIKACTFPVAVRDGNVTIDIGSARVGLLSLQPISEVVKFKHEKRTNTLDTPDFTADCLEMSLAARCAQILNTSDPELKIELTTRLFADFAQSEKSRPMPIGVGTAHPPETPPRQDMQQVMPWEMPNPGRGGTLKSRINMLHALANIEQWAIDLAIDICIRFADFRTASPEQSKSLPRTFYYDWLKVANDEAKHFSLLRSRLEELGSHFGALPVHHGLWDSAVMTAHNLRARICVIALVHEARGLDINPLTIEKFRKAGDCDSVDILNVIHSDEITHVTTGHRWLSWICEQEGTDPVHVFRNNVQAYFKGAVKGPFNAEARQQAGMDARYYENLSGVGQPLKGHVIAGG